MYLLTQVCRGSADWICLHVVPSRAGERRPRLVRMVGSSRLGAALQWQDRPWTSTPGWHWRLSQRSRAPSGRPSRTAQCTAKNLTRRSLPTLPTRVARLFSEWESEDAADEKALAELAAIAIKLSPSGSLTFWNCPDLVRQLPAEVRGHALVRFSAGGTNEGVHARSNAGVKPTRNAQIGSWRSPSRQRL